MGYEKLVPGTLFAGDYRVVRPLAEGGMGAVYVVEQLSTSGLRALKVMHGELSADAKSRERFDQEARLGGMIASEHVVKVIQAGVDEATSMPWLCMELLDGEDLATSLERRGALSRAEVATLFEQACHALALAHRVPIVHRDLKPENLFLSRPLGPGVPFSVKILDLGIAKLVHESRGATSTAAMGTPLWMAPEQADTAGAITPATDVWALGLIAFRALTGRHFWSAANVESASVRMVFAEVLTAPIPPASARAAELGVGALLPPGFDAWFAHCVTREPSARFAHAGEVRDALLPLLEGGRAKTGHSLELAATQPLSAGLTAPLPVPAITARTASTGASDTASTTGTEASPRRSLGPLLAGIGALGLVIATLVVTRTRLPPSTPPPTPSGPTPAADAASLRTLAANTSLGANRADCLGMLERADRLDPAGAAQVPGDVRARCEMAGGRCAEGRKRYRSFTENDPRVPRLSVDAMVRTVVSQTCPLDQLEPNERTVALQNVVQDAWGKGDADACLAAAPALIALFPTLADHNGGDEMARNTVLMTIELASTCAGKAGRCAEGRALNREYYRLAPFFAGMTPADADRGYLRTAPTCSGK